MKVRAMLELYDQLERISDSETSILLTGESGTGKELVARTIHQKSRRRDKPFVAINCGALPEALLESELFGHVKGAFTDARTDRKGLFEEADGGTLLLDEIGEMPMSMQVKLLRVLEEGSVRPVGGNKEIKINVRLLSATNRDLGSAIEEDRFREDLYLPDQRDSAGTAATPVTRHRHAANWQSFRQTVRGASKQRRFRCCEPAAERMLNYSWPGNIRELRNVIERAVALDSPRSDCRRGLAGENPQLSVASVFDRRNGSGRTASDGRNRATLYLACARQRRRQQVNGRPYSRRSTARRCTAS